MVGAIPYSSLGSVNKMARNFFELKLVDLDDQWTVHGWKLDFLRLN